MSRTWHNFGLGIEANYSDHTLGPKKRFQYSSALVLQKKSTQVRFACLCEIKTMYTLLSRQISRQWFSTILSAFDKGKCTASDYNLAIAIKAKWGVSMHNWRSISKGHFKGLHPLVTLCSALWCMIYAGHMIRQSCLDTKTWLPFWGFQWVISSYQHQYSLAKMFTSKSRCFWFIVVQKSTTEALL